MNPPTAINLHIDRVVIDEAVHRAGPGAVRAALAAQLPAQLAARGAASGVSRADITAASRHTAGTVAGAVRPGPRVT